MCTTLGCGSTQPLGIIQTTRPQHPVWTYPRAAPASDTAHAPKGTTCEAAKTLLILSRSLLWRARIPARGSDHLS